jgi:hypothetical protein
MMTPFIKLLNEAYKNDQNAVRLLTTLLDVFAAFESVEREEHVANADHILWLVLVDLPANPFFRAVADRVAPLLQQALLKLRVHRGQASGIPIERRALTDLAIYLCLLTSGPQVATLYAPILYEAMNTLQANADADAD